MFTRNGGIWNLHLKGLKERLLPIPINECIEYKLIQTSTAPQLILCIDLNYQLRFWRTSTIMFFHGSVHQVRASEIPEPLAVTNSTTKRVWVRYSIELGDYLFMMYDLNGGIRLIVNYLLTWNFNRLDIKLIYSKLLPRLTKSWEVRLFEVLNDRITLITRHITKGIIQVHGFRINDEGKIIEPRSTFLPLLFELPNTMGSYWKVKSYPKNPDYSV